ncbi:MAG: 23S rRNA (adenine(2503)-C(2))-methyltransferase RlmN [Acidobacteria bacterium]|nr:23S rRNA (adenine(2503)-C(2))-methyltransferase RlmN [Acidobacteriota bacterium]
MEHQRKRNLVGAGPEEIRDILAGLEEPGYRARQIYAGIYARRLRSWDAFTELGKPLRERLKGRFSLEYPPVLRVFESKDGTRRFLFELSPGQRIEAVFIPEEKRDTVCISTQVGCAVGCLFCATGRLPMQRNLTTGEIVGQVLALEEDRAAAAKRLNVVIMGMGEPLLNYDNVMRAIRLMADGGGMSVSPRRITLSTAGVVPGILALAAEPVVPNLAISLNATTDAVRDTLVPINKKWNIDALLGACRGFPLESRRRITFEYVLIGGVNDSPIDAHRLAKLLKGMRKKVNLIPLNAADSISLKPPDPERVLQFQKILIDRHITANIRRSRGADIAAACGMLAAQ